MTQPLPSIVVLISGGGSNLQAIIDATQDGRVRGKISAVISNKADAYGLERAKKANIPTKVLDHREYEDRESFDAALGDLIEDFKPSLIILAGFMRILTEDFVRRFEGRMLNIHPSLLPKYRGLHTHKRAIEAGDEIHGASVHFVTPELDGGPAILQAEVPILDDDTPESLASRVLEQEHVIYPLVASWFTDGRIRLDESGVVFDDKLLQQPLKLDQVSD
ncbi:MAG: phosphoribosylglycinamide formyltransferase [Gammaproteobacteria bacterium]|nr:phosphoribosylglycinamide formyltransferase [Gammaproteobacteria bacterium]